MLKLTNYDKGKIWIALMPKAIGGLGNNRYDLNMGRCTLDEIRNFRNLLTYQFRVCYVNTFTQHMELAIVDAISWQNNIFRVRVTDISNE